MLESWERFGSTGEKKMRGYRGVDGWFFRILFYFFLVS